MDEDMKKRPVVDLKEKIGKRCLIGFVQNDYAQPGAAYEADILSLSSGMVEMNVTRDEGDIQHIYRAVGMLMLFQDLGDAESGEAIHMCKAQRLVLLGDEEILGEDQGTFDCLIDKSAEHAERITELEDTQREMSRDLRMLIKVAKAKGMIV